MTAGAEKMATAILSSATYKLILGGNLIPKSANITGKTSKKKVSVEIFQIGNQYLLRIPFASIMIEEKEGFSLNVQL